MSERAKYPSEAAERFQIRLPAGLRDRIRSAAEVNSRSMNSEIVSRLEDSFGVLPSARELIEFIQSETRYKDWAGPILAEVKKGQPDVVRRAVEFLNFLGLDVTTDIREWKRRSQSDKEPSVID